MILLLAVLACSPSKTESPEEEGMGLSLRLAATGVNQFESYIHSLSVYAFRLVAGGSYVYDRTLAELDAEGIRALTDVSGKGDTKFFRTSIPAGEYQFFVVGNADGKMKVNFEKDVTQPGEVLLRGDMAGQDSVYFIGNTMAKIIGSVPPVEITLNRAVSKLVGVLHGVPSEVDSIRIELRNIARYIAIDGTIPEDSVVVTKNIGVNGTDIYTKDTVVFEMITLPTTGTASPFFMTFRVKSGQQKTKEMPSLQLLPDKYIRVNGIINDEPGALLSFKIAIHLFIFDRWVDRTIPDFILKPAGE